MKKIIILSFMIIGGMLSCKKDFDSLSPEVSPNSFEIIKPISKDKAQKKFAQILSKAVYNDEAVRRFIHKEALKQFDRDYDILYGKVKNMEVKKGVSFKDALDVYAENDQTLDQIEKSAPLINILLPDLEFVGGMSAKKWDILENHIGVIPDLGNTNNTVYGNGDSICYVPKDEIPAYPILVVKDNERMKLKVAATKSSEAVYEFIDQIYNKKNETKGEWKTPLETKESILPTVPINNINKDLLNAMINDDITKCQRDHIYFKKTGESYQIRNDVKEFIKFFRLEKSALNRINEANSKGDQQLKEHRVYGRYATKEEILRGIWTDGAFEFEFTFSKLVGDKVQTTSFRKSFKGEELFRIPVVTNDHLSSNWFRHSRNAYNVKTDDMNKIETKWIDLTKGINHHGIPFPTDWNILNESSSINIDIIEVDNGELVEEFEEVEFSKQSKWSIETGITATIKNILTFNIKGSYGSSNSKTVKKNVKRSWTNNSDKIGNTDFYYKTPFFENNPALPKAKTLSPVITTIGSVNLIIRPERI